MCVYLCSAPHVTFWTLICISQTSGMEDEAISELPIWFTFLLSYLTTRKRNKFYGIIN